MPTPPTVLVIAGSDSAGGAGVQADLKSAMANGAHATTVITAVTAQNSIGVHGIWPVSLDAVRAQFRSVMDDIGADAIKVGMLGTRDLVDAVSKLLTPYADRIPIVVDPVCASKHGDPLLADDALDVLRQRLLPLATVVTPNLPEAALLLEVSAAQRLDQQAAAAGLVELGALWALVKGGHADGSNAIDVLYDGHEVREFVSPRSSSVHTHGTGCTLATAIAAGLAANRDVVSAVAAAKDFISGAIDRGYALGQGIGPVDHAWRWK